MNRREALSLLTALPAVKSIAVADVKPNDVIVVESDQLISDQGREHIRASLSQVWPDRKIVILDPTLRLRIARETP